MFAPRVGQLPRVRQLHPRLEAGEADAGRGGEPAEHAELADAAVLDLHVAEAVEALLVGVVENAEGFTHS